MKKFINVWRLLDSAGKQTLADKLMTQKIYLTQIAHGHRNPGKHFKVALEREIEKLPDSA